MRPRSRRGVCMPTPCFVAAPTSTMNHVLASSRWLTCPRPDPRARLRLWCVPFAGGGAAVWQPWALAMAGLAEIVAVRAPGREDRFEEPPLVRLTDLVGAVVENLSPYLLTNYVLCGISLGALVVFEVARALRARGLPAPRALVVCAARAPHYGPDRPLMHPLPQREFVAEVERRYGPMPPEIRDTPEILDLVLPTLRADITMYETYVHADEPPLAVPILALGGRADGTVSSTQLHDWREHTTAPCEVDLLPGGHFFAQDNFPMTSARVRAFLGRVATV